MTGVYDVLTWLKGLPVYDEQFEHGYCGKLDAKKDKSLGVYPLRRRGKPYRAFGGLESYEIVGVSLLIHYNRNVDQSQYAANKLFEQLREPFPDPELRKISDRENGTTRAIKIIDLTVPEPVFVGTDDNGIYEFVIELELYVEKEM